MERLWIRNGLLWTGGDAAQVLEGGLLTAGDHIEAVGKDDELRAQAGDATELDVSGRLVIPGFINAHMHLYSTLARGLALAGDPPRNFPEVLERLWWRLDRALEPADLTVSAEVALLESLQAGVTTVIDHHASPSCIDGSLDRLADAAQKLGPRLAACYEVSERNGYEEAQAGIEENLRFAARAQPATGLAALFGLHAGFTLSDQSLARCAQAGRDAGLAFHVHVAEDRKDVDDARAQGHDGALARLHALGLITPGSLAIHCVHTSRQEWDLLVEAQAHAIHNPQSNLNNAVGVAPIAKMIEKGVSVGIGSDGMQADIREEVRAAFLLGHHASWDPSGMWPELASLLRTNRHIAGSLFGLPLGVLEPGAGADIAVFDSRPPTPLTAQNFFGHLLFGLHRATAHTVIGQGRLLLQEGQPTQIDPTELAARARAQARRLWQRI